jgi:hypothetical protein
MQCCLVHNLCVSFLPHLSSLEPHHLHPLSSELYPSIPEVNPVSWDRKAVWMKASDWQQLMLILSLLDLHLMCHLCPLSYSNSWSSHILWFSWLCSSIIPSPCYSILLRTFGYCLYISCWNSMMLTQFGESPQQSTFFVSPASDTSYSLLLCCSLTDGLCSTVRPLMFCSLHCIFFQSSKMAFLAFAVLTQQVLFAHSLPHGLTLS